MVRESLAHTDVAISESRLSNTAAGGGRQAAPHLGHPIRQRRHTDMALIIGAHPTLLGRIRIDHTHRGVDGVDDAPPRPALPLPIRSANDSSSWPIRLSLTSSVRAMITCTVRQSVRPAANSAATLGSRASSASAWATSAGRPSATCSSSPTPPRWCGRTR